MMSEEGRKIRSERESGKRETGVTGHSRSWSRLHVELVALRFGWRFYPAHSPE